MLRIGSPEKIQEMFQKFEREITIIIDNIIELTYFMRGAVDYDSALMVLSAGERDRINSFISKRLESESKSPYPNY